ncbi:MAG: hypothetical protein H0Z16_01825 [Thermodesulfobacterium sp.]|nr:hypothetical protein [Thermodesulfobacterium sp.]
MSSARTGPRILHILGSAGRGGTEVNTYAFCFLGKISPIAEDLEHEGLKTYYLPWTIPMVVLALYRLFQVNYYYAFFKTLAGLAFAGKRDR